jgi:hypothetical protein
MQMAPGARSIPFTAEQQLDSTHSSFTWQARLDPGKLASVTVIDAYQESHGRLSVKLAGLIPAKKFSGPDVDKGELQRYLASLALCPPMLLNHPTLQFEAIGPFTLRISDSKDPTHAAIDLDISEQGCPEACRADRPRLVGKHSVLTPWSAIASEFRICENLRIPFHLEVRWHLPEAPFVYYRSQLTSFHPIR